MILTTGSPVVWLILLSLGMRFSQLLSLLVIPGLDFPLKLLLHDYSMLISHLSAHFMRVLSFLISVVTFLIHSPLTSGMRKFSRTCKIFVIAILIRVKVRLEFTVLFSLFFLVSIIFIYIYIYLCCDDFLLYVTREFPISISHVITLIHAKYSVISHKNFPSLIILSPYVSIRLGFSSPLLWKKGVLTISLERSPLSLEASCFLSSVCVIFSGDFLSFFEFNY